jgi:tRNA-(ms[2]io[6]A)-hydroxylase
MLMLRAKVAPDWFSKVRSNIPSVLVDHAHLEKRAATTALTLERYPELYDRVEELNAIAIEELEHFQLVMNLLRTRNISYGPAMPCPWIKGLMRSIRGGKGVQVIDHLLCCTLIEGRSCEKFQLLAEGFEESDPELATFYGGLVESEGNHYAAYLLMARQINERETERRLNYYLDLDAELMKTPNPWAALH